MSSICFNTWFVSFGDSLRAFRISTFGVRISTGFSSPYATDSMSCNRFALVWLVSYGIETNSTPSISPLMMCSGASTSAASSSGGGGSWYRYGTTLYSVCAMRF